MKILIVQLARLGDIYQTWPVLRQLKHKGHEVHLLVREKFKAAAMGCDAIDKLHVLDSKQMLGGVLHADFRLDESLFVLDQFIRDMKKENYDHLINLSFSPFSSYLSSEIIHHTKTSGYTLYEDEFLCIPDDASAYFFAQVGPGKPNRIHVTDLFAEVAGVELSDQSWLTDFDKDESKSRPRICIHLGASQKKKTFSPRHIADAIVKLREERDFEVVLIGSPQEVGLAEQFKNIFGNQNLNCLVGKTRVQDLLGIIGNSDVLLGADSAPMHIASLVGTPALNLSCREVSFYETGPRSWGSRVLVFDHPLEISSDEIHCELRSMLDGSEPIYSPVIVAGEGRTFVEVNSDESDPFEVQLLGALYLSKDFPENLSSEDQMVVDQMYQANLVAIQTLQRFGDEKIDSRSNLVLNQVDQLMNQVEQNFVRWAPLVRWYNCEKLRIGPMDLNELIVANLRVHQCFQDILNYYHSISNSISKERVENEDRSDYKKSYTKEI